MKELDAILSEWIGQRHMEDVVTILNDSGAVVGPMYDVSQIYDDPHYKERGSFVNIMDDELGEMNVPNVFAKFSRTPGKVRKTGPHKGEHNQEILQDLFGLSDEELIALKNNSII